MKYSLVLLPAVAQGAASPTRATATAWPKFAGTLSAVLAADTAAYVPPSGSDGAQYKAVAFGYYAYRAGGAYFPAQKFAAGGTAANTVGSMGSTGDIQHTFYSYKAAPANPSGTAGAGPDATGIGAADFKNIPASSASVNAYHTACDSTDAHAWKKCYGGVWTRDGQATKGDIAKRLLIGAPGTVASVIKKADGSADRASNASN